MASWIAIIGALTAIFGGIFAVMASSASRRGGERDERLRIVEKALNHPAMDDDTRRQIVAALAREARGSWVTRPESWARLCFGAGWVLFLIAGGFLLLNMLAIIRRIDEDVVYGLALLGLALMTLPLGMREFISRDRKLADSQ